MRDLLTCKRRTHDVYGATADAPFAVRNPSDTINNVQYSILNEQLIIDHCRLNIDWAGGSDRGPEPVQSQPANRVRAGRQQR
jgi:hypothetical protein